MYGLVYWKKFKLDFCIGYNSYKNKKPTQEMVLIVIIIFRCKILTNVFHCTYIK